MSGTIASYVFLLRRTVSLHVDDYKCCRAAIEGGIVWPLVWLCGDNTTLKLHDILNLLDVVQSRDVLSVVMG